MLQPNNLGSLLNGDVIVSWVMTSEKQYWYENDKYSLYW